MSDHGRDKPRPPGTMIGGYRLEEEVGRGGMGSVYRAVGRDGAVVAVKLLASHLTSNPILLQRFQQEAKLAQRLNHPNLVRALELGEDHGEHFFAMEFVDGESVGARLKKIKRFSEPEALRIAAATADALDCAHRQNLIHRDVKPDNILLPTDGGVKLADMGLAKDTGADDLNLTKTGRGLGTPHFMAPEQFKEAKKADARCDIYSLGATLYMMVTGQLPFRAANPLDAFVKKSQNDYTPPEQIATGLSDKTARTIKKAMDADPSRRPRDMQTFAALLRGAETSVVYTAKPESPDEDPNAIWYVVYYDGQNQRKKVKGAQELLVQMIQMKKIGPEAQASREKTGPFKALAEYEAFRQYFPGHAPIASAVAVSSSDAESFGPPSTATPPVKPTGASAPTLTDDETDAAFSAAPPPRPPSGIQAGVSPKIVFMIVAGFAVLLVAAFLAGKFLK